ncbi:hypothetical protein [Roseomonas sp. CECT 9278]|uniref:hypothetical protein n=1 Tax=Roseomonas sp. CECT 9278 TaxID=2845823 RepID=UPI001E2EB9D2|nr:hypothetical protein [Roseomonas sp. CECT 9278]
MRWPAAWRSAATLAVLLVAGAAMAQPARDPRSDAGTTQIARCAGTTAGQSLRDLQLQFVRALPYARDILAHHGVRATVSGAAQQIRVELHLRDVRDLALPDGAPPVTYLPGIDGAAVLQDRRSRIPALWRVDAASVVAADRAYDIRDDGPDGALRLEPAEPDAALADYAVVGLHGDRHSGFAALVLEARGAAARDPHRIYAIAGTHVFERTDLRGWASGLTMGRAQVLSNGALRMVREAADYARRGEVFVTGQSQGGLSAQGVGYLVQALLDSRRAPHRLVHIVSWGASGAQETLLRAMARHRAGAQRGYAPMLERHWAATDPDHATAAEVWRAVSAPWDAVPPGQEASHLAAVIGRTRAIGYFFEIDIFARGGTFMGQTFAFPTALVLPDECDMTVAELVVGAQAGPFGVRLESHFLKGYRRAVGRGAIALARPARPTRWQWFSDLMPALEDVGDAWLDIIHLANAAATPRHWQGCTASAEWFTQANRVCRADWWPGCGPREPEAEHWCLVRHPAPGRGVPPLR